MDRKRITVLNGENIEYVQLAYSYLASRNAKWMTTLENGLKCSYTVKHTNMYIPHHPAIPFLEIYS